MDRSTLAGRVTGTYMLINVKTLIGFKLNSLDGEIGKVKEFYFDDQHWTIRYLVADTGNWLTGRQVLVSPYSFEGISKTDELFSIGLTKKQIEDGPSIEAHVPISRQFEESYHGYYGLPMYWGGPYMWGTEPFIIKDQEESKEQIYRERTWDSHLRSSAEVTNYDILASDGSIGHVSDFILDLETWAIRYLVVDTGKLWPGKKVLIAPKWIKHVSWTGQSVLLDLSQEAVKSAPEYDKETIPNRDYEQDLHQYYSREGYWVNDLLVKRA